MSRCTTCNGDDGEAPCAYPSEGKEGCLRDHRMAVEFVKKHYPNSNLDKFDKFYVFSDRSVFRKVIGDGVDADKAWKNAKNKIKEKANGN